MITFETVEKRNPIRTSNYVTTVKVFLDGKHVGTIREVTGGYKYFARGNKIGGETFRFLGECKRSLLS